MKLISNNVLLYKYQCEDTTTCHPIEVNLSKGTYKFELWGAQGGEGRFQNQITLHDDSGGKGAYVSGVIKLDEERTFYLYIGGKGEDQNSTAQGAFGRGGYNGGGNGGADTYDTNPPESSAGGGGATDIRLISGEPNNIHSLRSRIIVVAAGGAVSATALNCKFTNETNPDVLCINSD